MIFKKKRKKNPGKKCYGRFLLMKGFIGTLIKKAAESASDRDVTPGATAAIASSLGLVSAKSESKFVVCVCNFERNGCLRGKRRIRREGSARRCPDVANPLRGRRAS